MYMQLKRINFIIFLLSALFHTSFTHCAELPPLPQPTFIIPAPPAIDAKSFILIDYLSDHVISEQDVNKRVEPASLTKMMTVYVVDQAIKSGRLKMDELVRVNENAWRTSGSRMFLELNSTVPVEEILKGIIIQSGNDASVAIAEHIAGSEESFAQLMNFYAKEMGMVNTHFVNATGLPDPNHYSSAKDMAILAKNLIHDFPKTYAIYSQKEFTYKNIRQINRNKLLWKNDSVDGIKTGFTDSAGYCLVASGQKDNMRLIAVIMGAKTDNIRNTEANKLLTYGFHFYETRKLYSAGNALKKPRIWMGKENSIPVGLKEDLYITIGQGQYDKLKASLNIDKVIKAPIQQDMALGKITIQMDDKVIMERPVVALSTVPQGGVLGRLFDTIVLTANSLWDKATSK